MSNCAPTVWTRSWTLLISPSSCQQSGGRGWCSSVCGSPPTPRWRTCWTWATLSPLSPWFASRQVSCRIRNESYFTSHLHFSILLNLNTELYHRDYCWESLMSMTALGWWSLPPSATRWRCGRRCSPPAAPGGSGWGWGCRCLIITDAGSDRHHRQVVVIHIPFYHHHINPKHHQFFFEFSIKPWQYYSCNCTS